MAIKVLVVDDSALASNMISDVLASDDQITVVGTAANGKQACALAAQLRPDVITLDIWMPIMDGFGAVEQIMAYTPTPILVITSSSLKEDVQISLRMLAAGALDVIEKPTGDNPLLWERQKSALISRIKLLAGVKVVTHLRGRHIGSQTTPDSTPARRVPSRNVITPSGEAQYQIVALAASTGGPTALLHVLQPLPTRLPAALLIVQHIAEGFTTGLAEWLNRQVTIPVHVAQDGDPIRPGNAYLAPDRRDMRVIGGRVVLSGTGRSQREMPSADVTMDSVSRHYGPNAIGVVLTGMGNDGARGLAQMHRAGAHTIVQDEATSIIYGMPRAAIEIGAADEILPLDAIGPRLLALTQEHVYS